MSGLRKNESEFYIFVDSTQILKRLGDRYGFRRGTTAWKTENVRDLVVSENVKFVGGDEMDTS